LRSAWIPAPPLESEPAIVSAIGIAVCCCALAIGHLRARDDIQFTKDCTPVEAPEYSWLGFYLSDNIMNSCEYEGDDSGITVTFPEAGRYVLKTAAGFANYEFGDPVIVLVKDAEHPALHLGLDQRYTTLYDIAVVDDYVGSVYAENFDPSEGDDCQWSIERVDENEGAPAELYIGNTDGARADINFHIGEGLGDVTYRVTLTVGGMSATQDVSVSVTARPEGLPTGISMPCDSEISLPVGGTLSIDFDDIAFATGSVPAGYKVWRDVWTEAGDWGKAYWYHDDETNERTFVFDNPGRYILTGAIGIGNHSFRKEISVVVKDEETLDPGLNLFQRYTTLYTGANGTQQNLGYISVDSAVIRDGEQYEWDISRADDNTAHPVRITLSDPGPNGTPVDFATS
jgi:hypothetical protein